MSHSTANKPGGGGGGQELDHHDCFEICDQGNILEDEDDPVCAQCEGNAKTAHGIAWERAVNHMVSMDIANNESAGRVLHEKWRSNTGSTDIHDIDFKAHLKLPSLPENINVKYGNGVSVKLIQQKKSVCMGKLQRIYDNFNHKWSIVVGFYVIKQKGGFKCLCVQEAYLIKFNNPVDSSPPPTDRDVFFGSGDKVVDPQEFEKLRLLIHEAHEFMGKHRNDGGKGGSGGRRALKRGDIFDTQALKAEGKELDAKIDVISKKIRTSGGLLNDAIKLSGDNKRLQGAMTYNKFKAWVKTKIADGSAEQLTAEKYPRLFAPVLYDKDSRQRDPGNKKDRCVVMGGKRKTKKRKRRRKRRKTHKKRKRRTKKKRTKRRKRR